MDLLPNSASIFFLPTSLFFTSFIQCLHHFNGLLRLRDHQFILPICQICSGNIYISSLHPHRALLLEERATGTIFYCSYLTSIQSSLMASILLLGWGDYKSWFALVYPSILSILMFVLYFSFFKQKNFIFKKQ